MNERGSNIDLAAQRAMIHRRIGRANRVLAFNLGTIVVLALLALVIARETRDNARRAAESGARATSAEREGREELFGARLAQARAERLSAAAGRRQRALEAIQAAAAVHQSPELLGEAVATLATFDLGMTLSWHAEPTLVTDPEYSADFERVLTVQDTRHFTLSHAATREVIHQFEVPDGQVIALGFSPDDRWIVCYVMGREWFLWDAGTWELKRRIPAVMNWQYALHPQFSPDSRQMILCLQGKKVKLVNLDQDDAESFAVEQEPTKARPDPEFEHLAIACGDELLIWSLAEQRVVERYSFVAKIGGVAWHPGGQRLGLGLSNGDVVLLDWQSGVRRTLIGHNGDAYHVVFHPSGSILASASWDGSTRFWDAGTGRPLFSTRSGLGRAFNPAGDRMSFVRESSGFGVWEVLMPAGFSKINLPLRNGGRVLGVDFAPNEKIVASCDESAWFLHTTEGGRQLHAAPFVQPRSVVFSKEGDRVFVSGRAGLEVYRLHHNADEVMLEREAPPTGINYARGFERATLAREGHQLVVVGYDKGYVLDAGTLEPRFKFGDRLGLLTSAALSADGKWLAATTWKGAGTFVWNAENQKMLGRLLVDSCSMDFHPTGGQLATCNLRGYQIWNPGDWKILHQEKIESGSSVPGPVRFSPDGSVLAVAADRQEIALVDPISGRRLVGLVSPDELNLTWLAFSPSGRFLAAATEESDVHIWDFKRLREALAVVGLTWPKPGDRASESAIPSKTDAPQVTSAGWMEAEPWIGAIVVALLLAILFAVYALLQHRRLAASYEGVERIAEDQRSSLLAAEAELQQSRKMQALGTLAAGVAHDFNNLLSVISLSNDFLNRGVKGDPNLGEETDAIARAVAQGRQVIESMLGYSRDAHGDPCEFDLCELVEDAVGLLGQQFLSGIRLTLELDRALKPVVGLRGKLEQVLLNLIVNAGEAMKGQGRLLIRVHSVTPENLRADTLAPAAARAYLELLVQDSGPGIPAEVLPRVFEPFFTTKNVGAQRGTGLGLSTIYTVAEQEGYGLDLQSILGSGTTFRITVPLRRWDETGRQSPSAAADESS